MSSLSQNTSNFEEVGKSKHGSPEPMEIDMPNPPKQSPDQDTSALPEPGLCRYSTINIKEIPLTMIDQDHQPDDAVPSTPGAPNRFTRIAIAGSGGLARILACHLQQTPSQLIILSRQVSSIITPCYYSPRQTLNVISS